MTAAVTDIPVIKTPRLILRAPRAADFDRYAAFRASPRSRGTGGPFTRAQAFEQFCAIVGHWTLRGFGRWLVADRQSDAPLGVVGLFHPEDWPEPEIGWSLFDGAEGHGYAFEAALASRAYAYDRLGWTRVISLIAPDNLRSLALARRVGARHEGDYSHPRLGAMQVWRHLSPSEIAA